MRPVKFRKDENGQILAYFPKDNYRAYDNTLKTCYSHIGQHSSCHPAYIRSKTTPATPEEYKSLLDELQIIGYDDLKILK